MIIFKATIIIFISLLNACNLTSETKRIINDSIVVSDSVTKDIPLDKNIYNLYSGEVLKNANINSLEEGFNGMQIRIWLHYWDDKQKIVILSKIDSVWNAQLVNINYQYNIKLDSLLFVNSNFENVIPNMGLDTFANSLIELDILELPHYSKIDNYSLDMDSDAVTVEVATKRNYRIYSYPSLSSNQTKHIEAKQMARILDLIKKEFNIDFS